MTIKLFSRQPNKDAIDSLGMTEEALQRGANSPYGKEVIRRFLALPAHKQAEALASLNWQQSYRFRRMLGPEWTKKEDAWVDKSGAEIWPEIEAYIASRP